MWSWWSMISRRIDAAGRGNDQVATRIARNPFWSGVRRECPDFESFVMHGPDRFERLRRPQLDYLRDRGRRVDFIGRTERLEIDLSGIAHRWGATEPDVARRNSAGTGSGEWREQFRPAMRARGATLFATDIEAFGYSFDT